MLAIQPGTQPELTVARGAQRQREIFDAVVVCTGLASRREQLDWLPKARALAAMFGTDDEVVTPVPAEELSLEDLDDDEEGEEGLEDIEDAEPTPADLTKAED